MEKKAYNKDNQITEFVNKTLSKFQSSHGYVLSKDFIIVALDTEVDEKEAIRILGGKPQRITYIKDDNYDVYIDEQWNEHLADFNFLAFIVSGYELYGEVIILKKEKILSC